MTKTFCDMCKQCIDDLSIREVGRLNLQSYDLTINYYKIICPKCSEKVIKMIDDSCNKYILEPHYIKEVRSDDIS